jgi:hypothetical protein
MSGRAGWIYCMSHPAWSKIGMCKLGMTARDPSKRAAEICSSSGLIAPVRIEFCLWVEDRRAAEQAVKDTLGRHRVRGRRELFRIDATTARAAIESASCRKSPVILGRPSLKRRRRRYAFRIRWWRASTRARGWRRRVPAIVGLPVLAWVLLELLR